MKICLFNLENFFLLNSPAADFQNKPLEKVEWIARTIFEINADIYLLCEIGGLATLDLFNKRYLNSEYFTACLKGNSDRGIEIGYLIKKKLPLKFEHSSHSNLSIEFNYPFEILENEILKKKGLALIPPHKFSRDISELKLIKENKVVFIILLVHLKSKLDKESIDPEGKLRRQAEVKALVKKYLELKKNYQCPIVVAGDFNGNAQLKNTSEEFRSIYSSTDLQDVLEVMNLPIEQRKSYFYFNKDKTCEAHQLDYLFLSKELHSLVQEEESGIYHFRNVKNAPLPYPTTSFQRYALPSDHYPVVVSLKKFL